MISRAGSEKPYLPRAIRVPRPGEGTLTYLASHLHFPHIPSLSSLLRLPRSARLPADVEAVKLKALCYKLTSVRRFRHNRTRP